MANEGLLEPAALAFAENKLRIALGSALCDQKMDVIIAFLPLTPADSGYVAAAVQIFQDFEKTWQFYNVGDIMDPGAPQPPDTLVDDVCATGDIPNIAKLTTIEIFYDGTDELGANIFPGATADERKLQAARAFFDRVPGAVAREITSYVHPL